jgi:uridine kinase
MEVFFFLHKYPLLMRTCSHTHTQDHDVREENILFVSILAAKLGLHSVAYAYPRVRIITSAVDKEVNKHFHIIPGVGNYGDRYFGTEPY